MSTQGTPVTNELRTQIIAAIKGGASIASMAEQHQLSAKTIARWMRQMSGNVHATTNELQKAKKHISFLEHVILGLVLEQQAKIYKA